MYKNSTTRILETDKRDSESIFEYQLRLGLNREKLGLSWEDIRSLMEKQTGETFGESKYRKEAAAVGRYIDFVNHQIYDGKTRILCISDLHFPFTGDITPLMEYEGAVDILIFNGDIVDCQSISKFRKTYRSKLIDDMAGARIMMSEIIDSIRQT